MAKLVYVKLIPIMVFAATVLMPLIALAQRRPAEIRLALHREHVPCDSLPRRLVDAFIELFDWARRYQCAFGRSPGRREHRSSNDRPPVERWAAPGS